MSQAERKIKVADDGTGKIIKALLDDVIQREIKPSLDRLSRSQMDNRRVFRIMAEMVTGMELMWNMPDAVTMFGSARSKPRDPVYKAARYIARRFCEEGYAVITGGGPGIMEAANRGATEADGVSIGLNITLPAEQKPNKYVKTLLNFHYFFIRKVMFVKYAKAFIIMPGGFGTMDELFESLTLKQTGKMQKFPIILFDSNYWAGLHSWMLDNMVDRGYLESEELDLLIMTDDPDEVVNEVVRFCRSQEEPYTPYIEPEDYTEGV